MQPCKRSPPPPWDNKVPFILRDSNMQTVRVNIRRRDLARVSLVMLPRLWSTRISWLTIAVLITGFLIYKQGIPATFPMVATLLLASFAGATGGIAAGFVFSLLQMAVLTRASNGVLGEHTFMLCDDGLHESTAVNESMVKWSGITAVDRTPSYIYIQVAPGLFHVLPRRDFESAAAYDEFWEALRSRAKLPS